MAMEPVPQTPHSDTVTEGVRVRAAAQYVPAQSDPDHGNYVFVYRIAIANEGSDTVRLESRHWIILDARGDRRDVRGPGVVGEFPELAPGERFEYTSACPLPTEWGTMEGSYRFRRSNGEPFDVAIARFFLVPTAPPLFGQGAGRTQP